MKIGIDVDGVLANFNYGAVALYRDVTGRDLFLPGDDYDPPVWNFAAHRGYTKEETSAVWERIKASSRFWRDLPLYEENCRALTRFARLRSENDVYFITSRLGLNAKDQTEGWFRGNALVFDPTVLIVGTGQKGNVAKALNLDCYIDDYYENCIDVVQRSPTTRCYVLDRNYNRPDVLPFTLSKLETNRAPSLKVFLQRECLIA